MSAISSAIISQVSPRAAAAPSTRRAFAGLGARLRAMLNSSGSDDLPASDRSVRHQSDHERCAIQYGSTWNEIRNQVGVWR